MTSTSGIAVHLLTAGAPADGRGHVARTIALAEALIDGGARVSLEMVRGAPTDVQTARLRDHGVRFGAAPFAAGSGTVVVDLPDPNRAIDHPAPAHLVVFDDRALFRGSAAIVVQPSLPAWHGPGHAARVLAGTAYAPLRSELRSLAAERRPAVPPVVVICFGGSDPADATARLVPPVAAALEAVGPLGPVGALDGDMAVAGGTGAVDPGVSAPVGIRTPAVPRVVAIVGPAYAGSLAPDPAWAIERDPPDLDRRLAEATVALVGGGTMKLEAAALGVPAIVVAVADDQLAVAPQFAAGGACRYVGDGRTTDPTTVGRAVASLFGDEAAREAMSAAGRAAVDGRGAERVARAILRLGGAA